MQKGKEKVKDENDGRVPLGTDEPGGSSQQEIVPEVESRRNWDTGKEGPVRTIFFQGMGASQLQLAKYTGSWGFLGTTGERFGLPLAMEAIRYPFVGREIPEVVLAPPRPAPGVWTMVRHPLLWMGWAFTEIVNDMYGFRAAPSGCCLDTRPRLPVGEDAKLDQAFPDRHLTIQSHALRMDRINVGQEGDVAAHHDKWRALQRAAKRHRRRARRTVRREQSGGGQREEQEEEEEDPVSAAEDNVIEPCVLYGVSRGAAATVNAMATHRYDGVRLIVLEGCFDTVSSALRSQVGGCLAPICEFLLTSFTAYTEGGMQPLKLVSRIPTHVPVAFVTSRGDEEVPPSSTLRVVDELRSAGHERVHVLMLRRSRHPRYMLDDLNDRDAYTYWLHAVYRLYRLPHLPEYAELGEELLDESEGGAQDRWFEQRHKEQEDDDSDSDSDTGVDW